VRISQRALGRFLERYGAAVGLKGGDRTPALLPLAFDASLSELLPTLSAGATVILGHDLEKPGMGGLARLAREERWTFLTLPAAYFALWTEFLGQEPPLGLSLRAVAVGGSALGLEAVSRWQSATLSAGHLVPVLNVYGLTESSVASSWFWMDRPLSELGLDPEMPSLPVGEVGPELLVVNEALSPTQEGEILLGGDQRCLGTLDGGVAGAWLRTGDLARVDARGRVVVLGRRDDQLKVRGQRIHRQELERRLLSVPGIAAAAVMAIPGTGRPEAGPRLVAFCVDRQGRSSATLAEAVEVPGLAGWFAQVRAVRSLPLTSRGKPDMRSLEALAASAEAEPLPAGELTGALEALRSAFRQLLGRSLSASDLDADFRSLGGDSLLALGARTYLSRTLGLELSVAELLSASSLSTLLDGLLHRTPGPFPPASPSRPEENA